MSRSPASRMLILALSTFVLAGIVPIFAQIPKQDAATATTTTKSQSGVKKVKDIYRRVPDHFGQIGLSNEQKERIYEIKAKHSERMEALKKEIADLQSTILTECEGVLDASQKEQLQIRRANAAKGKKAQGAEPKPSEPVSEKSAND